MDEVEVVVELTTEEVEVVVELTTEEVEVVALIGLDTARRIENNVKDRIRIIPSEINIVEG